MAHGRPRTAHRSRDSASNTATGRAQLAEAINLRHSPRHAMPLTRGKFFSLGPGEEAGGHALDESSTGFQRHVRHGTVYTRYTRLAHRRSDVQKKKRCLGV